VRGHATAVYALAKGGDRRVNTIFVALASADTIRVILGAAADATRVGRLLRGCRQTHSCNSNYEYCTGQGKASKFAHVVPQPPSVDQQRYSI
jgi:hypothetical protein